MSTKPVNKSTTGIIALVIIVLGLALRLIPHAPNAAPVEGLALLGGAYISRRHLAFLLPLVMLYLGDLVLNNTILRGFFPSVEGIVWYSDYMITVMLSMVVIVALGIGLLRKVTALRVLGSAVLGSVVFFLITNLGVWAAGTLYPPTGTGLLECYIAAIPYFRTSLMTTVVFSSVAFFVIEYASKRSMVSVAATAEL